MQLTVRPGDTLIGIGGRYLNTPLRWRELQRLNKIRDPRRLPGRLLLVPAEWLRWSGLSAEVVFVTGVVTGNKGPVAAGMRIAAGDSFDTGTQGAVTLRFSERRRGGVRAPTPRRSCRLARNAGTGYPLYHDRAAARRGRRHRHALARTGLAF